MVPLLKGVRLLELSTVVMGPLAGQILADLGADIIKLESIEGDVARNAPPRVGEFGALFANNNRNKRAIAIDLKTDAGRNIAHKLIARADALLINMRPQAAARLQLGFDAVAQLNPNIVYCSVIGYGERGPYRGRPAFDDVIQAAAGLADVGRTGDEVPRFVPTILADKIGALHAVYGLLGALLAKARGHEGALYVEAPMFEALASFVLNEHLAEATFRDAGATGYSRVLAKDRRPFRTQDGWIAVLPYTQEQWRRFLDEAGRQDLVGQPWFADAAGRYAHTDELYSAVAEALSQRTTAAWSDVLSKLDIPFAPIATLQSLLSDPHLAAIGFFDPGPAYPASIRRKIAQPVSFGGIEAQADSPPRALGADTRSVLHECGYSDGEIDEMVRKGEVSAP
jgi:crotonobetainyl-CoA:carnitine CoA-transferase CaiB-like acyl-CoA transferase